MPDVSLTDEQIAQLAAIGIIPAPDVDDATTDPTPPPAPAPAPPTVIDRDVVSQTVNDKVRYGIVTKVADTPSITGTDTDGNDVHQVLADVAWFGLDGLTTVAVDELTAIG